MIYILPMFCVCVSNTLYIFVKREGNFTAVPNSRFFQSEANTRKRKSEESYV